MDDHTLTDGNVDSYINEIIRNGKHILQEPAFIRSNFEEQITEIAFFALSNAVREGIRPIQN